MAYQKKDFKRLTKKVEFRLDEKDFESLNQLKEDFNLNVSELLRHLIKKEVTIRLK